QVFLFAELLSLRHLSIPGTRLAEYSHHPNGNLLTEIMKDKILEYSEIIEDLTQRTKNLRYSIHQMESSKYAPLNQTMLVPKGFLYYQRSMIISGKTPHSEALLKSAPLVNKYAEDLFSHKLNFAFLPSFTNLEDLEQPHDYRLILFSDDAHAFSNPLTYPPSLYLTLILKDRFHSNPGKYIKEIQSFMKSLHLKSKNILFITLLRNIWNQSGESPAFYTKLELQVEYVN
ncbi:hypothetical protein, partial [Dialister sp.]|uniref:hypothetical protein n=1 Tax=Dialister sp. TaxID=1955814 RepID=UPI003F11ED82